MSLLFCTSSLMVVSWAGFFGSSATVGGGGCAEVVALTSWEKLLPSPNNPPLLVAGVLVGVVVVVVVVAAGSCDGSGLEDLEDVFVLAVVGAWGGATLPLLLLLESFLLA